MVKVCIFPKCETTEADGKIMISVPKNVKRRTQWFAWAGIKGSLTSALYCCEDHFALEEDADNWQYYKHAGKYLKLKQHVVPHLSLDTPRSPSKKHLSDSENKRKIDFLKALKRPHHTHNDVPSSPENRILGSVIRKSENESKQLNKHKKGDTMNERLSPPTETKRQRTKRTSPTSLVIHTSDSYSNDNEGGKYVNTTEPEVVCHPLENLDYTDWKNTKTICATDVSDSELDETRSSGQSSEALGASEEPKELRSESTNSEAVKPASPTVECDDSSCSSDTDSSCSSDTDSSCSSDTDSSCSSDTDSSCSSDTDSSTLRVLGRYSSRSCQTDEQSLGGPGHSRTVDSKIRNFLCDRTYFRGVVDLTKPQAVDRSSGMKRIPISRVRPAILRRRPGKDVGKKKVDEEGRGLPPSKSTKGENRPVSNFLCDQIGSRVVDLTESQEVDENCTGVKAKLTCTERPVIRPGKDVGKEKVDEVGRCLLPSKSAKGNNLPPVSDFLCDQIGSRVVDLTESQEVDENCTGVKARLTCTERPVIPSGKDVRKEKVGEVGRCLLPSKSAKGEHRPVSDFLCDQRGSRVVDLTESQEVDETCTGVKAKLTCTERPVIRPGKDVGKEKVDEVGRCLLPSKSAKGNNLPPVSDFLCDQRASRVVDLTESQEVDENCTGVKARLTCTERPVIPPGKEVGKPDQYLPYLISECETARDLEDLNQHPPFLISEYETDRDLEDLNQHPPYSITEYETDRDLKDLNQHPPYSITEYETDRDLKDLNQHPPVHQSASNNDPDSQGTGMMDLVGTRTTTLRDRALKESHQIGVEHAYCLKSCPNQSYVIGEPANFISDKLITKSFPQVMKYKPVIRVPNKPSPRKVELSNFQTRRVISSDEFEQYGIVRPLPTNETDAVARVDDAASNAANQDGWKMKRYQPSPEIARLYLLVQKRLGLPCYYVLSTHNRDGRPPFSYQTIAAMVIESDPLMAASAKDIFDFMQKHFPFYRKQTSKWWRKNVRFMLSMSRILRKDRVGRHVYYSFRKEVLLPGDPFMYEMNHHEDEGLQQGSQSEDDDYEWNDSPPDLNSCYPQDKLLDPKVKSAEPPELDPLMPLCSYSDEESNGFPVIVNAATYTLDRLPPHAEPEGDQYKCDREIKEESDDGSSPEAATSSSSPDGKRVYSCQYCPAVFNTLQGNLDHSMIHPEVMKPCPLCDFSSPDAVQLLWHLNSTHRNDN